MVRRTLGVAVALVTLMLLTSCLFVAPLLGGGPELPPQHFSETGFPEVALVINAAGGDAIDIWSAGPITQRNRLGELGASWLGFASPIVEENDFEPDLTTARDRASGRFIRRARNGWSLTLDTSRLQQSFLVEGQSGFDLVVCHPAVRADLNASRAPDFDALGTSNLSCLQGFGWSIRTNDPPLTLTLLLIPSTGNYIAYVVAAFWGVGLVSAGAWFLGNKLRRGPFRRRTGAAVAIGLIAGTIAAIGLAGLVAAIGAAGGPADNLALAKDLGVGMYAGSILLPALVATAPGIVFATLLVRRRPWPDEPLEAPRAWPPPPPPPSRAPQGPPAAPWGGR